MPGLRGRGRSDPRGVAVPGRTARGASGGAALRHPGALRFLEVKGRRSDAETITVTRNEILYSLNKPDDFILAIVEFRDDDTHDVHYVRRPFRREPDFKAASVNYTLQELLASAEEPR